MHTIHHLDPADLALHPYAKTFPEWTRDDPRYIALVESVRDRSIDQPLLVDREHRILVGAEIWLAAKQLQLATVPAIVRTDDPASVILSALLNRKHYTASARAYLAYPLLKEAHEEARVRNLNRLQEGANLKKGHISPIVHAVHHREFPKKIEDFALEAGISRRLFMYAAQVHELFAKDTEFKAAMEPAILSDDPEENIGLGRVIAGYAGQKATKDMPRRQSEQLELFETAVITTFQRFTKIGDIAAARPVIKSVVSAITAAQELENLLSLAAEIEDQVKARKRTLAKAPTA